MLDRRTIAYERARQEYVQTLFEEVLENDDIKDMILGEGSTISDVYLKSKVITESGLTTEDMSDINKMPAVSPSVEQEMIEHFIDADDDVDPRTLLDDGDDDIDSLNLDDPDEDDYNTDISSVNDDLDDIVDDIDDDDPFNESLLEEAGLTEDELFGDLFK